MPLRKGSFRLLILLVECVNIVCGQDEQCLSHHACIKDSSNKEFLAPCVRHAGKKAECETEALSSYYKYEHCTPVDCKVDEKNHCESNPCKNNGECHQMFGSYSCTCINNFHGRNCEETLSEVLNLVKDVHFIFSTDTTIRKSNMLHIFIREGGDELSVEFNTGDGGEVIKVNQNQMLEFRSKQKCKQQKLKEYQCKHLPDTKMLYRSVHFQIVYTMKDSVIMEYYPDEKVSVPGFKINHLSFKIFNKMLLEFSDEFNQVVSYRDEVCPVQVVITQNCGKRSDEPLQLNRKTRTVISSFIKKTPQTEKECPNQIVEYKWDIFGMDKFWAPWLKPINSVRGVEDYIIEPFTLKYGLYKAKLTVIISGHTNSKEYNTDYFGLCYFEVVKVPLEINILGGVLRTVPQNEHFALNASLSYDPNESINNQSHLFWNWTCNGTEKFCKSGSYDKGIFPFPNGLPEGTWKFTLILKTKDISTKPVSASQTIVIVSSESPQAQITISCLKNCGFTDFRTNPKEVVYLEAVVINSVNVKAFQWTYFVDDTKEELNAEAISQATVTSNILIIKENVLKTGSTYTFKVRPLSQLLTGSSTITFIVNKPPEDGSCRILPEVGQKAVTEFFIDCANFSNFGNSTITQLSYEFYQKENLEEYPGTMLGYSISGQLNNVILTQTDITVRVIGAYGIYTDVNLTIGLEDWVPTITNIDHMLTNLQSTVMARDSRSGVRIASAIMDVMNNVPDKLTVVKKVLKGFTLEKINDLSDVKMFTSVLKKVVKVGVGQIPNGLDGEAIESMGTMMAMLSESMLNQVSKTDMKGSVIIVDDIKRITQTMLECTDAMVNSKDKVLIDPESSYRAVFASLDQHKEGTANMIDALYKSGEAILTRLLPHEEEIVIQADYSMMWIKVEDPEVLSNVLSIPQNVSTNIKINKKLATSLKSRSQTIDLMVTLFNKNPYWWDLQVTGFASELISVSVWDRSRRQQLVTRISEPLDIYFRLNNTASATISGYVEVSSLKDKVDMKDKDSYVTVHSLEATPENSNGKLFVEFVNLQTELRVWISENIRPDYDLMISNARLVSSNFSILSLPYRNLSANTLHFIGILPGDNVVENQTISYTFNVYYVQCKLRYLSMWASPVCTIGEYTTKNTVHCKCSHMSLFGSSVFVGPNTVHPIKDLHLLMTLKDNPLVFMIVVSLLIIYLILLIWLILIEQKDKLKRKVIVLDDNFPGENYAYLVVVFTSFSFGSGTKSNVGIKLIGSESHSRAHILGSRTRRVLKRNTDDWFLLFTKTHLGDLEAIHIWHDNSGPYPEWCCRKVLVYDLTSKRRFTFVVEQWLTVRPGEYPEAVIKALGPTERYELKQIVVHNLVYHLQENHFWASIFIGHPRSTVSKSQRLTITFCIIFITFLTGIMFYGVARGHVYEDEPKYAVKYREIFVAIQSTIMSAVASWFVLLFFRKGNNVIEQEEENDESDKYIKLNKNEENTKHKFVVLKVITKALHSAVKGKPLMPILVGTESYESVVRRRKWLRAGWIISQVIIWTSAYFIILYGLKLGKVVSELWVTTSILSFSQGAFVNAPLKIVAFSTFLAVLGEMYNVDTYECNIVAAMQSKYSGDLEVLKKILVMRASSVYRPLSRKSVKEFRNNYLKLKHALNLLEFIVTILFLLVVLHFAGSLWVEREYYINSHISNKLTKGFRSDEPSLYDVDDFKKLIDFLITIWTPNIYQEKWYNRKISLTSADESLPETGWFMDATHRMVGIPRLRQIRIQDEYCPLFMFDDDITLAIYCYPKLTNDTLDTELYGLKWSQLNDIVNKPLLGPWVYQQQTDSYTIDGQSGATYHSGGYIALLKNNERDSASMISDLRKLNWLNIRLRALISEVSLYNPNTNTYSAVIIITEHLPSSAFTNRITTRTVQMDFKFTHTFLYVCTISYFNFRLLYVINRHGIFESASNFWICYDFILVLLANTCIIVHWIKLYEGTNTIHTFKQVSDNDFFQFYNVIYYQINSKVLWGLLWFIAPLRILAFKFILNLCSVSFLTLYRSKWSVAIVAISIITVSSAQIIVFNFTICPENIPVYKNRYLFSDNVSTANCTYNQKVATQILAVTCGSALIFVQIILIHLYKSGKSMYIVNKIKF